MLTHIYTVHRETWSSSFCIFNKF